MTYPSRREMEVVLRTKKNGKMPTMKVMVNEIISAASAESLPLAIETKTENSMKSALTSNAKPMFLMITFQFISF